mgnify:CR=1 FL=1
MKSCGFNFDTTYTDLPNQFFTKLNPATFPSPKIIIVNYELAASIGLDFAHLNVHEQADLFSGKLPKGATPFSQAYAGHQFGHFTMLGDGRAHMWGEHVTSNGSRFDIQFKGSGRTPYSRNGDGKAVLGPMLREYIISEAMYYLGIPTTRSLAVVTTGESVMRESSLPGSILTRTADSHIRVGTFEFAASQRENKTIKSIMDYTIWRHFPDIIKSKNQATALIQVVMEKQVDLIIQWMRVGFIHGVMNTDNMILSGETIDYGPCAFMDAYDPNTVFSSIDYRGRYAFINQPRIAQWNLARFAESLLPLIDNDEKKAVKIAEELIDKFSDMYYQKWLMMMRSKIGLTKSLREDEQLIQDLLGWMHKNHADFTNTFLDLSQMERPDGKIYLEKSFEQWYLRWQSRIKMESSSLENSINLMRTVNPVIIPRNHKVEEVLAAANAGDVSLLRDLLDVLKAPYENKESYKIYQDPPTSSEYIYQTFCGT